MKGLKKWLSGVDKLAAALAAVAVATATGLVALTGVVQQVVDPLACAVDALTAGDAAADKPCDLSSNKVPPPARPASE